MSLLRCAVYIRVSSDEQAKYGDSLRDQKERGIEYIKPEKTLSFRESISMTAFPVRNWTAVIFPI